MKFYLKLLLLFLSISYIFADGDPTTTEPTTTTAKALGATCVAGTDTCVANAECVKASSDASGTTCNCKSGYTKSGTACVADSSSNTKKDTTEEESTSSFIKISLLSLLALFF